MVLRRLSRTLDRPVDAASCAVFRVGFGLLLLISTVRFFERGWIREYYVEPKLFFHYWGFGWIQPLPARGMYALYALIGAAALCILLGFAYRVAAVVFALGFSYAHFCDKTNYLNHYYLVSLLAGLAICLPLDREFSLRVWRRPEQRRGSLRAWVLYLLRFQIAVVYVFGGVGKLGADWLLRAEPLRIWLAADTDLPLIGPYLSGRWIPFAFSWAGAIFDLSIVPLLSWRSTRAPAYLALILFHSLTALLFPIGMFPWIMIAAATLFWDPSWPRRAYERCLARAVPIPEGVAGPPLAPLTRTLCASYASLQLLLPLRSALYPGNTLWTEEGFRFSWKVMLIEKAGSLELRVVDRAGRRYVVEPREYLTPFQARMASTQSDMILELAHWVAQDFARRGQPGVHVYADSQVSFNGRARLPFLDPARDLAREEDGLGAKDWLLPAPNTPPLF